MTADPPAPSSESSEQTNQKNSKIDPKVPKVDGTATSAEDKKLSGAALKAKAKAEKLARRAQAKAVQPPAAGTSSLAVPSTVQEDKSGKSKTKKDSPQTGDGAQHSSRQTAKLTSAPAPPKAEQPTIPECFSHLPMAKRISPAQAEKDVHPAVLLLGQQMGAFAIRDSSERLEVTLLALRKVISSYVTPQRHTFCRHFTPHGLNPQIDYLAACRPMSFSMGNAVRWLKLLISNLDVDLHDEDAKLLLCNAIDLFILNRIREPGSEIAKRAANMVTDGSTIVTYGCHHLVERTILYTKSRGLRCNVVIIDDPYERRGRSLAKRLRAEGLDVTYCSDLSATIRWLRTSTVLLGAEAIFSNGALYAQTGTGDLAAAAAEADARIITLCEIVNFTERVALDSLTYNEVSPEQSTESGFRLLFDSTMPELTGDLVTENGVTGTALIPRLLRKLEDIGYGSFK